MSRSIREAEQPEEYAQLGAEGSRAICQARGSSQMAALACPNHCLFPQVLIADFPSIHYLDALQVRRQRRVLKQADRKPLPGQPSAEVAVLKHDIRDWFARRLSTPHRNYVGREEQERSNEVVREISIRSRSVLPAGKAPVSQTTDVIPAASIAAPILRANSIASVELPTKNRGFVRSPPAS